MKKFGIRTTILAIATTLFVVVTPASTATLIAGLYNTGVLDDHSLAPGGTVDLHYALMVSSDPSSTAFVTSQIPPSEFWPENGPDSQWLAPDPNQNFSGLGDAPGHYVYRLVFDLTGFDPNSVTINGQWATDDIGIGILVNGASSGNSISNLIPFELTAFTLSSGFISGLNTLDFWIFNVANDTGINPTGLRVEFLSSTAQAVPLPGALWLFGAGLISLFGIQRKTKR